MLANSRLQAIIWTSRMDEARTFYRDVLGLPLRHTSDGACVFDVGGTDLRVSPVPSTEPSKHTVMGFAVPDLNACIGWLTARGIRFERFAGFDHDEVGAVITRSRSRVAWFRDPDGNILSVVQFAQLA